MCPFWSPILEFFFLKKGPRDLHSFPCLFFVEFVWALGGKPFQTLQGDPWYQDDKLIEIVKNSGFHGNLVSTEARDVTGNVPISNWEERLEIIIRCLYSLFILFAP